MVRPRMAEQLRRKHADGFLVEVRGQLARDEHAVGGRETATRHTFHLAGEAHDFLQR